MVDEVLGFEAIDASRAGLVGGKGANLGALSRLEGLRVPAGFCVTTVAFERIIAAASVDDLLARLSRLEPDDREAIGVLSAQLRRAIEGVARPADLEEAITRALAKLGERSAYAVRSSATAEDSPNASFAGQHDTYLNVVGRASMLEHVSRCWASLFTERAVTYRLRSGFDHRKVSMAVVVQQLVVPHAAGLVFTADPVTFNRKVTSVEASFGLGEALVSGLVNPDVYRVRDGEVLSKVVATKRVALEPLRAGGTQQVAIAPSRQTQPALTDAQVVRLAQLGRQIEAHFGRPQDIEWCLVDDDFQILQSRPITTLFPLPVVGDRENHVYLSVGHQQMMTDPMKPLGLSLFQLTALRRMDEAGGRLFVDVTKALASPASRAALLDVAGKSDPLLRDALQTVIERDFIRLVPDQGKGGATAAGAPAPIATDPTIVTGLIARSETSVATLTREIREKSGVALLDFILEDLQELKRIMFDAQSQQAVMAGIEATWWLNDRLQTWLGEKNAADVLTQSVPNNVTSEMGLALLAVADVIRPHPEVVAFLRRVEGDDFVNELGSLAGGPASRDALQAYLDAYGMRCVGEIDVTRPRWSERPSALVPLILGNLKNFEPGAGQRRFEQGLRDAANKEQDVLARLRALPDGASKAEETKRMIDRVRTFIGYREYPKYSLVSRHFIYKKALLYEAERLARAGVLQAREDIFWLTLPELREVVRTQQVDAQLIAQRQDAFRSSQALTPPRVLTSEGEVIAGAYRRDDVPAGALIGLAVSAGTIEGRARVIFDLSEADLEPGDILVTPYTDPSWTPLFVSIKGLVTEVGGVMTHGAVIAREYGVPAVVGVEHATRLISDGQRLRVNGIDGYVELLPETAPVTAG